MTALRGKRLLLRKRAWREAAALLESEMSAIDLPPDLDEDEEEYLREYIRTVVVRALEKRGEP